VFITSSFTISNFSCSSLFIGGLITSSFTISSSCCFSLFYGMKGLKQQELLMVKLEVMSLQ
jgi:hypothetical protein